MDEQLLITALTLLFFPVLGVVTLVIILASFGKSLGIRKTYVKILLKIFEVICTTVSCNLVKPVIRLR